MEIVRAHFRPEFLNRLDEIILLHRLAAEHMGPIVDIQVGRVQNLLKGRDRKSTRLNSRHVCAFRMPSSACKKNRKPTHYHPKCIHFNSRILSASYVMIYNFEKTT